MTDEYLNLPPKLDQRIVELHAWVATYDDGAEGILSADLEMPAGLGVRHMPLISSRRDIDLQMKPFVDRIMLAAGSRVVTVRMESFRKDSPHEVVD